METSPSASATEADTGKGNFDSFWADSELLSEFVAPTDSLLSMTEVTLPAQWNAVLRAQLHTRMKKKSIDNNRISSEAPNSNHDSGVFVAGVVKYDKPKSTVLIQENGKLIAVGNESYMAGVYVIDRVSILVQEILGCTLSRPTFPLIFNLVSSSSVGYSIDLARFVYENQSPDIQIEYSPQQFPGASVRLVKHHMHAIVFCTGKINYMGYLDALSAYGAHMEMRRLLAPYRDDNSPKVGRYRDIYRLLKYIQYIKPELENNVLISWRKAIASGNMISVSGWKRKTVLENVEQKIYPDGDGESGNLSIMDILGLNPKDAKRIITECGKISPDDPMNVLPLNDNNDDDGDGKKNNKKRKRQPSSGNTRDGILEPPPKKYTKHFPKRVRLNGISGNLFESGESLAHCVSADMRMGRGIAVQFVKHFGRVDELKQQRCKVGESAVLTINGRYIYYLVTKEHYNEKPTMETLERSLISMRTHALDHHIPAISMPRIGCGLDKLKWAEVEQLLLRLFPLDGPIKITIYTVPCARTISNQVKQQQQQQPECTSKETLKPALDVLGELLLNGDCDRR